MALPIIILGIMAIVGIALFLFGISRESLGAGFIFTSLAALIFIVSGLMLYGGLELTQVEEWVFNAEGTLATPSYVTLAATNGSATWLIATILTYGGFGLSLLSLGYTVSRRRAERYESADWV